MGRGFQSSSILLFLITNKLSVASPGCLDELELYSSDSRLWLSSLAYLKSVLDWCRLAGYWLLGE